MQQRIVDTGKEVSLAASELPGLKAPLAELAESVEAIYHALPDLTLRDICKTPDAYDDPDAAGPIGAFSCGPIGGAVLRQVRPELFDQFRHLLEALRQPDEASQVSHLALQWFERSQDDLGDALYLSDEGDRPSRTALYLGQQSVEKALKGLLFLSATDVDERSLRKLGHNLVSLFEAQEFPSEEVAGLTALLARVEEINPHSTKYRYPRPEAAIDSPDGSEMKKIISHVEAVVSFVCRTALTKVKQGNDAH